MRFSIAGLLILYSLGTLCGCAGIGTTGRHSRVPLSGTFRRQARQHAQRGDLHQALVCLKIARALDPANTVIKTNLEALEQSAAQKADDHFRQATANLQNGSRDEALQNFLTALRYHPDHTEALASIHELFTQAPSASYTVRQGDTLEKIADRVYQARSKAFLIAYFNDMGPHEPLDPGAVLRLPRLEAAAAPDEPDIDIDQELARAQRLFKADRVTGALTVLDGLLEVDPANEDAARMACEQGKIQWRQNRFLKAREIFRRLDPEDNDCAEDIAGFKRAANAQAEQHFKKGIDFYVKQNLKQAIEQWEKTLELNPGHPEAAKNIVRARSLLKQIEQVR